MKVALRSPLPEFHKELFDILDIFINDVERLPTPDGSEALLVDITEHLEGINRECRVKLFGVYEIQVQNQGQVSQDALLNKRLHKRQLKLVLFDALISVTGIHPPWGSLTGIRPTRLMLDAMEAGESFEDAAAWLQSTFHLNDEKIELLKEIITVQAGLPQAKPGEVSCYIGIPFCASRCRYCSFISREAGDGELLGAYTDALVQEIKGTIALMAEKGLTARTVYVGGGTPTVLSEGQLALVLKAAAPLIQTALEVTVEAGRADTITRGKIRTILEGGAERISVNPQTLHDRTLETVGRNHTAAQAIEAYHLARELGFHHINMDLIAGLPGENLPMFRDTLSRVLALSPEAITVHTLSVKRSSDMRRYRDPLPNGQEVEAMVSHARKQTGLSGYRPYYLYRQKHMAGNLENVGYAKPGYACLYNIDMMEDRTTVLAMGAGSVSKLVSEDRKRILRAPNVKDVEHYLDRTDEMLERKRDLFRGIGKSVRAPQPEEAED